MPAMTVCLTLSLLPRVMIRCGVKQVLLEHRFHDPGAFLSRARASGTLRCAVSWKSKAHRAQAADVPCARRAMCGFSATGLCRRVEFSPAAGPITAKSISLSRQAR